jgi:hypothetical protein
MVYSTRAPGTRRAGISQLDRELRLLAKFIEGLRPIAAHEQLEPRLVVPRQMTREATSA